MMALFGRLGVAFGRLGSGKRASPPPEGTPEMNFSVAANSQLLAVLLDF
jgi:hypothetical protein